MSAADKPVGRSSCVITALVILTIAVLLLLAFILAVRGEFAWQRRAALDRLFLVNQPQARGLGLQTTRPYVSEGDATCSRTRVRFFLWTGTGENVEYCECVTPDGPYTGSCP